MNTIFDKIYVVSLITNKDRQEFIKYQFDELGLDFEFIYGTNFKDIKYDYFGNEIKYPWTFNYGSNLVSSYGCAISHYNAVAQAYYLGYNNVLILEDDVCFLKERTLIEYYLNNIPKGADFVSWDPRFFNKDEYKIVLNKIKKSKNYYIILKKNIITLLGGMMYGIMNRDIMQLYLNNQYKKFKLSDHIDGIYEAPILVKRYISSKCICTDQHNIENNFNANLHYECIYKEIDDKLTTDLFYKPNIYFSFSR